MQDISEKVYWIWLSCVPGVGARRFQMLNDWFGSPKNVWECQAKDILKYKASLGETTIKSLLECKNERLLENAFSISSHPEVFVLTLKDEQYPPLLRNIFDPPAVLYCKGNPISGDKIHIAVIGSRRTSEYGRQMAERFSFELSSAGICVVSGAARGIDTMAHKGALRAEGSTVAVLGCGVDIVYPGENRNLFRRIEERGTLISEYPPGTYPSPSNFPARNRIISGISRAVLVIEAGEKSGALITVDFALEQGKDVYALPGNLSNPYCAGTNKLLKEGARLVTDTREIIEEIANGRVFDVKQFETPQAIQLDIFETEVYNALEEGEKFIDDLVIMTGIHIGKLNAALTMLEIKGMIKQLPGNAYIRR